MARRLVSMIAAASMLAFLLPFAASAESSSAQGADCQEFDTTGFSICGEFLQFWNANGGIPVFGYPLSDAHQETNPDTGQPLLVQYFERQRFELHPENQGTVFAVLFGRLGAQILTQEGRDWWSFPKADPSADHYFAVTGHAIAPMFWNYWSSHGIDLGDSSITFRESLMLFGYPLSEPMMELNPDGDTVLTQWFERAVFEYHPDNPADSQVLLRRVGAEILTPPVQSQVIATGLTSPRGLTVTADGTVYVAEAGTAGPNCVDIGEGHDAVHVCAGATGAITKVANGVQTQFVTGLPSVDFGEDPTGPHDVVVGDNGQIYAVIGLGSKPDNRTTVGVPLVGELAKSFGTIVAVNSDGTWHSIADASEWQNTDPSGTGIDSNPFSLVATESGFVVSDAGGNNLIAVHPGTGAENTTYETLGVFPNRMVTPPPFLGMPPGVQIPMQAVPTGVVQGPDGAYYVGELTGFPFSLGMARVWRVTASGEQSVYADGFTNILGVAFDSHGNMYVLEMTKGGLLAADPSNPASATGALIKVSPDGHKTTVMTTGLIAPTGIAIGPDDSIYISNFGVMPGMGQVIKVNP
ncbi:MAG TPA: ScyD/ScyE family protein [Thermomicrobiales bacterium]|nr:ScyD/ScyE family protein [Thermomicrobiales bacterium]